MPPANPSPLLQPVPQPLLPEPAPLPLVPRHVLHLHSPARPEHHTPHTPLSFSPAPRKPLQTPSRPVSVGIQRAHKAGVICHHQRHDRRIVRLVARECVPDVVRPEDGGRVEQVGDAQAGGRVLRVVDVVAVGIEGWRCRLGVLDDAEDVCLGADKGRFAVGLARGGEPGVVSGQSGQSGISREDGIGVVRGEVGVVVGEEDSNVGFGGRVGGED